VTVSRSDYGIYLPVLRQIRQQPELRLQLIVAGMHLSPEFGLTADAIAEDGFTIDERVEMLLASDSPEGVAKSMGLGTIGFAQAYARSHPDILLVLGDRFEMHAAVVAAVPFRIPVAHIHGGEATEGAIDDCLRHSITKLSHLHFVATEEYAGRIIQMGEEPWRVIVSGAPSLDNLQRIQLLPRPELERLAGGPLQDPFLLVTYHPATLEDEPPEIQFGEVLAALEEVDAGVMFTYPGADTGSRAIIRMIHEFITAHPQARLAANLGMQGYFSAMQYARAMVGNSSSGIIEAASFRLPVVNIGSRQKGRVRGKNVIDVGCARGEILRGIRQALSPEFRGGLSDLINPHGTGHAADTIVGTLKDLKLNDALLRKRFHGT